MTRSPLTSLPLLALTLSLTCGLTSGGAHASFVDYVAVNIAPSGTASSNPTSTAPNIHDQDGATQDDSAHSPAPSVGLTFGGVERSFDKIILELRHDYVIKSFEIQVAKAGILNPDMANDSHWERLPGALYTDLTNNAFPRFAVTLTEPVSRSGVRIRALDSSLSNNPSNDVMRIDELWVFDRYRNIAPQAQITGGNLSSASAPLSAVVDEATNAQVYGSEVNQPYLDFVWDTEQIIGSVMIHGGSGAASEILESYKIMADLGAGLVDVLTVTGNTSKTSYDIFSKPLFTDHLRLVMLNGASDSTARVAEVFIFTTVPEPGTVAIVLPVLMGTLMRRRRR